MISFSLAGFILNNCPSIILLFGFGFFDSFDWFLSFLLLFFLLFLYLIDFFSIGWFGLGGFSCGCLFFFFVEWLFCVWFFVFGFWDYFSLLFLFFYLLDDGFNLRFDFMFHLNLNHLFFNLFFWLLSFSFNILLGSLLLFAFRFSSGISWIAIFVMWLVWCFELFRNEAYTSPIFNNFFLLTTHFDEKSSVKNLFVIRVFNEVDSIDFQIKD
jgi:hypothetical protein